MKQPKISIRPQSNQRTDFVTGILNSVVVGYLDFNWFTLSKSQNLNFYFLSVVLELFQLLIIIIIVEKISAQLYLSTAKNCEHFFFLSFC